MRGASLVVDVSAPNEPEPAMQPLPLGFLFAQALVTLALLPGARHSPP